ncbi:conserved hypothetical protein [Desulfosarcina cetonica]|nr:conserved hypothetical protein [Desulfosarcina cetonica]
MHLDVEINQIKIADVAPRDASASQPLFGKFQFVRRCDHNLKEVILLAERMIQLANQGDDDREDTGCGILFGMLRDSGYKIKRLAEDEKIKHIAKGWWDTSCSS